MMEEAWELAMRYRPIAVRAARRQRRSRIDYEDLVQEGLLALYVAALAYEPSKGSFGAYARVVVRRRVVRAAVEGRLPVKVDPDRWLAARAADARSEIAAVSENPVVVHPDGALVLDGIASPERDAEREADHAIAARHLRALPERERRIVEQRSQGRSLDAVGSELGLSRERTRQLERQALRTLRERFDPTRKVS